VQIEDQFISHRIWHIWITFATTWFIFTKQILFPIFMSKTLVLANQKIFKSKFDQMPKAPPFSIIKFLSHKIAVFAIKMILIKHK